MENGQSTVEASSQPLGSVKDVRKRFTEFAGNNKKPEGHATPKPELEKLASSMKDARRRFTESADAKDQRSEAKSTRAELEQLSSSLKDAKRRFSESISNNEKKTEARPTTRPDIQQLSSSVKDARKAFMEPVQKHEIVHTSRPELEQLTSSVKDARKTFAEPKKKAEIIPTSRPELEQLTSSVKDARKAFTEPVRMGETKSTPKPELEQLASSVKDVRKTFTESANKPEKTPNSPRPELEQLASSMKDAKQKYTESLSGGNKMDTEGTAANECKALVKEIVDIKGSFNKPNKDESFNDWKKEQESKKQNEDALLSSMYGHLPEEERKVEEEQFRARKNSVAQAKVDTQYAQKVVAMIKLENENKEEKTIMFTGVKGDISEKYVALSCQLDLKTPEQRGITQYRITAGPEYLEDEMIEDSTEVSTTDSSQALDVKAGIASLSNALPMKTPAEREAERVAMTQKRKSQMISEQENVEDTAEIIAVE